MGLFSGVTNFVNSVVDGVQDGVNAVADTVQDAVNGAVDGAQDVVNRVVDTLQDGFIAAAGGADGLLGTSLFSDAVGVLNTGIDTVQDVENKIIDKAQEAKALLEDTIQATANVIIDNGIQLPLAAPSLMADYFQTWIETGVAPDPFELDTQLPQTQGGEQFAALGGKAASLLNLD